MKSLAHSQSRKCYREEEDSHPGCMLQSGHSRTLQWGEGGGWVKGAYGGHTRSSLLLHIFTGTTFPLPTGQLAVINEQAGKEGDGSGVQQLQLKSPTIFLGIPFWASLSSTSSRVISFPHPIHQQLWHWLTFSTPLPS